MLTSFEALRLPTTNPFPHTNYYVSLWSSSLKESNTEFIFLYGMSGKLFFSKSHTQKIPGGEDLKLPSPTSKTGP